MVVEDYILNTTERKCNGRMERPVSLKERFLVLRKLGQGTYGKVQLAINKETNEEVAVKTIKKTRIVNREDMIRIRREIKIMSTIRHPNIIHIYEVFETKERIVLVMQYASGGELYDYLGCHKTLPEDEARRIFRQICSAIYYCHKNQICHRDLKLENILLDEEGNAKIADFGLSNTFDGHKKMKTFCGSPLYASPEIVKGTPYNGPEVDCWSLGVLLFALVYGTMPFDGKNFKELVSQISTGNYNEPENKSSASHLIRKLLTIDVKHRADIYNVCKDNWVDIRSPLPLVQLADSLSRTCSFEDNKIEKRLQTTGFFNDQLHHLKTLQPKPASKEIHLNGNYIPVNNKSASQPQNNSLSDDYGTSCEVIFTLNCIIDAVVESDKMNTFHEQKAELIERLLQNNGTAKRVQSNSEYQFPNLFLETDASSKSFHEHLIDRCESNMQSYRTLNHSMKLLLESEQMKNEESRSSYSIYPDNVRHENPSKNTLKNEPQNRSPIITCKNIFYGDFENTNFPVCDAKNVCSTSNNKDRDNSQEVSESEKAAFFNGNMKTECGLNRCGRKSSNLLFLQASRQRSNSLCKTLAFTFECGIFGGSSNKPVTAGRKLPGKVTIPRTFNSHDSVYLTDKERLIIFPCVSVSENKEIIQKKIDRVKKAALSIIPRRYSDVSKRGKGRKYTRSHTDILPGASAAGMCNNCILECAMNENSDFYSDQCENNLRNAHFFSCIGRENFEDANSNDTNNFSFCDEAFNNITSTENRAERSDFLPQSSFLNLENEEIEKDYHYKFDERNFHCDLGSFPRQKGNNEIDVECLENLDETSASNVLWDNNTSSPKRNWQNKCFKFFPSKHSFRKSKSVECQCTSRKTFKHHSNKYATSEQLFHECDPLNVFCCEWTPSDKSYLSGPAINECDFEKIENNSDYFYINDTDRKKYLSKLISNEFCCRCEKCILQRHALRKLRQCSSAPNLSNRSIINQGGFNVHKDCLSSERVEAQTIENDHGSGNDRIQDEIEYKIKNIASNTHFKSDIRLPIYRSNHDIFQRNSFDSSHDININSLNSKRALSDLDIRCNYPQCSRETSLDFYRIFSNDLSNESRFLEGSSKEFNQNTKKRTSTLPRRLTCLGRNISRSVSSITDKSMKLNSLKRIHEAEMELSKAIIAKQPEEENSGSLLEALKMHGYKNVISSRFQQLDEDEDELYYASQLHDHRLSSIDCNDYLSFHPSLYALNMNRKKSIRKQVANNELLQRKPHLFHWNHHLFRQQDNMAFHMNGISPLTDINNRLDTKNENTNIEEKQQQFNSTMQRETDTASAMNLNAEHSKNLIDPTYRSSDIKSLQLSNYSKSEPLNKPMELDSLSPTALQNNDSDKEESVSHRIWRKSFYSRFNHLPLSRRAKTFSYEPDVLNDSQILGYSDKPSTKAENSFMQLSDYKTNDTFVRNLDHRSFRSPMRSFSNLYETYFGASKKSKEQNSNGKINEKCNNGDCSALHEDSNIEDSDI